MSLVRVEKGPCSGTFSALSTYKILSEPFGVQALMGSKIKLLLILGALKLVLLFIALSRLEPGRFALRAFGS